MEKRTFFQDGGSHRGRMSDDWSYGGAVLVIGGARSGKSRRGLAIADVSGLERVLIATATAGDAEMTQRITRHRSERAAGWTVVEEPLELGAALARNARPGRIVVIDCVTFWLANLMFAHRDLAGETRSLAQAVGALTSPCVLVSNEVGSGIVPETIMGRAFRDAHGWLNQELASVCAHVELVVAGLPLTIKPQR
jgi:adenosylcobinamide kinase/adenosylcobinamide-phosphate guanylyltransferase